MMQGTSHRGGFGCRMPHERTSALLLCDALIGTAGTPRAPWCRTAHLEHWREMVDTNVMGLRHCVKAVLPTLLAAGRGHIVNLWPVAASHPYMGSNVYGGTKAFTHQLSLNLLGRQRNPCQLHCAGDGPHRVRAGQVRRRPEPWRRAVSGDQKTPVVPAWKSYLQGFVVEGSNPKTVTFFLALVPQVMTSLGSPSTAGLIAFCLIVPLTALPIDVAVGMTGGVLAAKVAGRPNLGRALNYASCAVLIGLAVLVLFE
ncbi:SDR family NAD(P)-dependent oxidoreductase [Actinacidiphila glaucinigra]|uniref:LysE family translocator n=1 Tax=Actinacidiphila glaucinigra TaxID=235986 RepID=UPI003D919767